MNRLKTKFYSYVDAVAFICDLRRRAEKSNERGSRFEHVALTKEEKALIKSIWGKWGGKYDAFGFYKKFCGVFNPYYVPDDYYDYAEHVLNLRWSAYFLQHKCNLKYFIPKQNRAKVVLQKIDGHFVKEDNTEITKEEAKRILLETPVFMAKVARGTGGGKGVQKINWDEIADKEAYVEDLIKPIDMEFEKVLQQSEFMSQFNPDSVNTMRLVTLNINGRCDVLSTFIRMGAKGSFVDNLSGGNGVLVGVKQDGTLNDFGITKKYDKQYKSPVNVPFAGVKIPDFEKIKEIVMAFQRNIPYANLIGWDIALDEGNNVIVIEVNLDSAEIEAHQVFNGPVFGDRLDEVIEYINMRKPYLKHQMMLY